MRDVLVFEKEDVETLARLLRKAPRKKGLVVKIARVQVGVYYLDFKGAKVNG